jgi:regulatory protein
MPERDPLDVAARALRHRDRSRRDVDDRLARAGVDAAARSDALETLERIGYVDDARFARTRAAALAERGYGDAYIRAELEGQGVPAEAVGEALEGVPAEVERAAALVARARGDARVAARLARKGFSLETLEQVVEVEEPWPDGREDGGAGDD